MFPIDLAKLATLQSQRLESDFRVLGRIGKGGFSKVYKVSNLLDKNTYALKKIELKAKDIKDSLDRNIERVQREARYLARLSHPKIIRYFNSWVEVIQSKKESVHKRMKEQEINDFMFDKINESQSSSKNDLDNIIFFKESNNDQISYSEQESEVPPQARVSRKINKNNVAQNKKSTSYDEKKVEFDKLIFYIQTEYCQYTLENYLQQRNGEILKIKKRDDEQYQFMLQKYEKEAHLILSQIVKGLDYLHNQCRLVHRDLKPGNIFMNSPEDVKIGDFGLVTKLKQFYDNDDHDSFSDACTQMYAAPEQISQSICDQKSDIYALGLIILQLFHPLSTSMELIKVMGDARKGMLPTILRERHIRIAEIILDCLKNDAKLRPNIHEIIFEDQSSSLSSSKKSSNEFRSESTEIFVKTIGFCKVHFDDEDVVEKYLIYNNRQIQIFKNQKSLKAQMIYNLSECKISLCEDAIVVQHNQLVNFSFTTTHNQDLYKELCELTILD